MNLEPIKKQLRGTKLYQLLGQLIYDWKKGNLAQLRHRILRGELSRNAIIAQYLKSEKSPKLHFGCGLHTKEGWLNADLIHGDVFMDACKRLPLPDSSVEVLYAEQFIEHISYCEGEEFLAEAYRVLKPEGKIRLATPDLASLVELYLNEDSGRRRDTSSAVSRHKRIHNPNVETFCGFINDMFRLWHHQFIYDNETLCLKLEQVGFSIVGRFDFGRSDDIRLQGVERHADEDWMKGSFFLIVEAVKPLSED